MRKNKNNVYHWIFYTAMILLFSGCSKIVIFDPKGSVGMEQKNLLFIASAVLSLIIVPVIIMSLWFPYKYRKGNDKAVYDPTFTHSAKIEYFVWGVPVIMVIFLAILSYKSAHALDPYRPLESERKPVVIQAVALTWKWLFIYPEQGIATINEIYFPKDVPVNFIISADAPMNSFFIPQLGSQIYAMAGMQTRLHLIANEAGTYRGLSANYSGIGFAGMSFTATATEDEAGFNDWVQKVKASEQILDDAQYAIQAQPSQFVPVTYYSEVKPALFEQIMQQYATGSHLYPIEDAHTQMSHEQEHSLNSQHVQEEQDTHHTIIKPAAPMSHSHNHSNN